MDAGDMDREAARLLVELQTEQSELDCMLGRLLSMKERLRAKDS